MFGCVLPGPPFLPHPPPYDTKKKVQEAMPIWVFRQAQWSGTLPEAWF